MTPDVMVPDEEIQVAQPSLQERIDGLRFWYNHIEACLDEIAEFEQANPLQTYIEGRDKIMGLVTKGRALLEQETKEGCRQANRISDEIDQVFVAYESRWREENPQAIPPRIGDLNRKYSRWWRKSERDFQHNKITIRRKMEQLAEDRSYQEIKTSSGLEVIRQQLEALVLEIEQAFLNSAPTKEEVDRVAQLVGVLEQQWPLFTGRLNVEVNAQTERHNGEVAERARTREYNRRVLGLGPEGSREPLSGTGGSGWDWPVPSRASGRPCMFDQDPKGGCGRRGVLPKD